jgi:hypothetical protein
MADIDARALERLSYADRHHWYNEGPILDLNEALELLQRESSTTEPHHMARRFRATEWEIVIPWYSEGDSGGDQSGYYYFQIDQTLAKRLVREKLVEPRRVNYMGGHYFNDDELVISTEARRSVQAFLAEMQTKACALLIPGVHTDLTGEIRPGLQGREQWRTGKLYYDFTTPNNERCRVYPETNEVVFPYSSLKTA